ncbi:alpha/beta-hydrolase [Piromyces finnis]|uniref:feruloyl esterase n=1 Tax=Piromyces finnis TaxID=1754191 RepID=A0A1Y1VPF1_9FUNG|nr:alpha/beta-hydrolase [Piromyces finnis]|eukprot:ORX61266.1 alpha/beta-hydrolase [Piromyces finnis]
MKTCAILSLVALFLTSKVSADCWSERLGWPCCSNSNAEVVYVDEDGDWGVENNDWCGIKKEQAPSNNAANDNNNPWGGMGNWGQQGNQGGNPWDQGNQGGNQGGNPWGNFDFGNMWGNQGGNNQQQGNQGGNPWGGMGNWGQQGNQGGNPWDQGNQGGNQGGNPWGNFDFGNMGNWGQGGNQGGNPWDQGNQGGNQWGQQGGNQWDQGNQGGNQNNNNDNQSNSSPSIDYTGDVDCSGKTLKSNTNLTINGRKVIVKFPSNFGSKPAPLLINFHPIMGSASQWESGSQTAKAALNDGAVVAFMDGAQGPMGQAWNVGPCCTDADDVQYTRAFIKEITQKACIDPKRIYAAGFSMGGGMSNYAGCQLADVIAAAAPSAFDLSKEIVDAGKCKPARPFPILNFRGTQDNVVMYNGGLSQVVQGKPITFLGAKNNLKEWAKMNGCTGEPKQNTPGNNCEMYENCSGGVKVGLCTINGGGHNEGDGKMGWDFLKQFTL